MSRSAVRRGWWLIALLGVVSSAALVLAGTGIVRHRTRGGTPASSREPSIPTQLEIPTPEPRYRSSITVADRPERDEAMEAARLYELVRITPEEATAAALARYAGEVGPQVKLKLENEDGNVVYTILIWTADGGVLEVRVDPGDGRVLLAEPAGRRLHDTDG